MDFRKKTVAAGARLLCAAAFFAALAACSGSDPPDMTVGWTPDKLYAEASDELSRGSWGEAIKLLEKLESRHPFTRWAQQALLSSAYAHYRNEERILALAALDRFQKLYPNHPALDYALYLRGLINFNEQQGLLATLGGQDLAERDLEAAREAFSAFSVLIARFPESRYATDARDRLAYLRNSMASGEVAVARYYFRRGAYVASANRSQRVISTYQNSPAVMDALQLLRDSYDRLGLKDLRDDTDRIIALNRSSERTADAGESQRRWWQIFR
jgi:outer membrane protein assembly factor BamD